VRTGEQRRALLERARLYLICDAAPGGRALETVLPGVLEAGVDVIQLRDKRLEDRALLTTAAAARALAHAAGALLIVNDRPDLALEADADGVHLGQDDGDPLSARSLLGPDRLIGSSTHTREQIDAATDVDYIGVGPVHATPTKPGRPAVGVALVAYAASRAGLPFFAIGGLDETNVAEVVRAGALRIAVVRAIADARDPAQAARRLRAALDESVAAGGDPRVPSHPLAPEPAHGTA
jgi:thiamine-phosphate pyrophosphorylase